MQWLPQTGIGRAGFWLAVGGILGMFLQYWVAIALKISVPPLVGLVAVAALLAGGVLSAITLFRKETAALLFLTALLGLFALFFIVGEFIVPH